MGGRGGGSVTGRQRDGAAACWREAFRAAAQRRPEDPRGSKPRTQPATMSPCVSSTSALCRPNISAPCCPCAQCRAVLAPGRQRASRSPPPLRARSALLALRCGLSHRQAGPVDAAAAARLARLVLLLELALLLLQPAAGQQHSPVTRSRKRQRQPPRWPRAAPPAPRLGSRRHGRGCAPLLTPLPRGRPALTALHRCAASGSSPRRTRLGSWGSAPPGWPWPPPPGCGGSTTGTSGLRARRRAEGRGQGAVEA